MVGKLQNYLVTCVLDLKQTVKQSYLQIFFGRLQLAYSQKDEAFQHRREQM